MVKIPKILNNFSQPSRTFYKLDDFLEVPIEIKHYRE